MSDDEMSSDVPTKMGEPPEIDNEIDEFAESAFDALLMDEGEKAEPKAAAPATTEPEAAAVEEFEDVELDDVIMVSDAPAAEEPVASAPPSGRPAKFSEAPGTAEVAAARLRSEISELKAKLAES